MNDHLKLWTVSSIEVLPTKAIQVTFGTGGNSSVRFATRRFAVGRRGAKAAALSRFAARAGFGDVEDIYSFICALPRDIVGEILPAGWLIDMSES